MLTRCPACRTILPLSVEELASARGDVRCGHCGEVFFALADFCDALTEAGQFPAARFSERPPTLVRDGADREALAHDLFLGQELPPPSDDGPDEIAGFEASRGRPSLVARLEIDHSQRMPHRWTWRLCTLLLTLVLAGQWVWDSRAQLQASARWRPWLTRVCDWVNCELPTRRALNEIRLVSRNVRRHPSVAGALIISATMQNQAAFPQPYPIIEIVLSDLNGQRLAMRRFRPDEYLENQKDTERRMPMETLLPMVFEVLDPSDQAVAFEFSFR